MSLEYCTPSDIPEEVSRFEGNVAQMGVGKSGKIGYLQLEMQHDSHKQKTVITKKRTQVPLYVQKALHYDLDYPSMAHLFVLSPSGGILQGDRYRMDVELKNNAICHITTQGATRIYKMESNFATHLVSLNLKNNSYLEFIPEQLIPYKNSRYYQKINLNVDKSSTLVYSEIIVPGRVAMGELFDYDICYLKSSGRDGNQILFNDSCILEPKKHEITIPSILGNNTILATVYIITNKENTENLKDKINSDFQTNDELKGGFSVLPNDSGMCVRILGNSSEEIRTTIYNIAKTVRSKVLF